MVQLKAGVNSLHCVCAFNYSGPGYTAGKIRCVIGHKVLGVWVEDFLNAVPDTPFSVPNTPTTAPFTVLVNIPIPLSANGGLYSFYAKMTGIPGADLYYYGPENDIEVLGQESVFSNLAVTYSKL
jgi:hypothetical protein